MDIMALERVMSMKLPKLIKKEMNYKDIYKEIKKLIEIIQRCNMKKITKNEAKRLRKQGKVVKTTHNGYYLMNV